MDKGPNLFGRRRTQAAHTQRFEIFLKLSHRPDRVCHQIGMVNLNLPEAARGG